MAKMTSLQRLGTMAMGKEPDRVPYSLGAFDWSWAHLYGHDSFGDYGLDLEKEMKCMLWEMKELGVDSPGKCGGIMDLTEAIMEASGILSEAPIYIDDSPQLRVLDIRSKVRRLHFERKIDLIIVDYLQLIQGDAKAETRVQEISKITRALKTLARELNVPVLTVSQLSRAVEWRSSHVPELADLRESGSIEQDADVVLFIYRDDKYFTPEDWSKVHDIEREPYPRGIADISIAKNRNGPPGQTVKLRFLDSIVKFDNFEAATVSAS